MRTIRNRKINNNGIRFFCVCRKEELSRKSAGFTLVELLVALSVFVVIFVGAIGTYLGALKNQRFLAELILINNNASLVMEQMAREMRTGYFDIGQRQVGDCLASISFTSGQEVVTGSQTPVTVTYALSGENITRTVGGNTTVMNSEDSTAVKKLCFKVIQDTVPGINVKPECFAPRFVIRMEV